MIRWNRSRDSMYPSSDASPFESGVGAANSSAGSRPRSWRQACGDQMSGVGDAVLVVFSRGRRGPWDGEKEAAPREDESEGADGEQAIVPVSSLRAPILKTMVVSGNVKLADVHSRKQMDIQKYLQHSKHCRCKNYVGL